MLRGFAGAWLPAAVAEPTVSCALDLYGNFDTIQNFESGSIYAGSRSIFEHGTLATIRFLWTIWA